MTFIGMGYIVTQEEKEQMLLNAKDLAPEISDNFHLISPRHHHFFGEVLHQLGRMDVVAIEDILINADFGPEDFINKYYSMLKDCGAIVRPGTKWYTPKIYVIHSIA